MDTDTQMKSLEHRCIIYVSRWSLEHQCIMFLITVTKYLTAATQGGGGGIPSVWEASWWESRAVGMCSSAPRTCLQRKQRMQPIEESGNNLQSLPRVIHPHSSPESFQHNLKLLTVACTI